MIDCLYCKKEFEPKKPKAIYCSNKCRTYANRKTKSLRFKDVNWVIGTDGVRRKLNRSALLNLLEQTDKSDIESTPVISNFKITPAVEFKNEIDDKVPVRINESKKDYQKQLDDCEFPDEYKALWDRINEDQDMLAKDKQIWKLRLNAK
jgi:hypothetical protein